MPDTGLTIEAMRELRTKLISVTGLQVVFDEKDISMDKPHLKLKYEGLKWDRANVASFKFSLTLYGSGIGEMFISDIATAEAKLDKDILFDPLTMMFSDKNMITTTSNYKIFVADNKTNIDIQFVDNKYIFAKPYQLEFQIKQNK
jgi:hypothetical protein